MQIHRRRTQKPEARQAAREAALREVKVRQQAKGGKSAPAANKSATAAKKVTSHRQQKSFDRTVSSRR